MLGNQINTVFVTFGAGRYGWRQAAKRISREARSTQIFSQVISLDQKWLKNFNPRAYAIVKQFHSQNLYKGFGYMIWKPLILKWARQHYPNLNILYMDSGSHIDQDLNQIIRFKLLLSEYSKNGLAWQLPGHKEIDWSKKEAILRIKPQENILQSGQIQSGFIYAPVSSSVDDMVDLWAEIAIERNGFYFSDELEIAQSTSFIAHRHDQSSFSMLWKMFQLGVKEDLTYPENLRNFPVIAMRNNSRLSATSSQAALATVKNFNIARDKILRKH